MAQILSTQQRYSQMGILKLPSIPHISLLLLPLILIYAQENCPNSFQCGTNGLNIEFPLYNIETYPGCGLIPVTCRGKAPIIHLGLSPSSALVEFVVKRFLTNQSAKVFTAELQAIIIANSCEVFTYFNPLYYPTTNISYSISPSITLLLCDTRTDSLKNSTQQFFNGSIYSYANCPGSTIYYPHPNYKFQNSSIFPDTCTHIRLPIIEGEPISKDLFSFLGYEFTLGWSVSDECQDCHHHGGQCSDFNQKFHCAKEEGKTKLKVILATVISGSILVTIMAILTIHYCQKWKDASSTISLRNISSNPSSKSDLERGGFFFGIPVFSYAELEEATNYFDSSRELGDGGFGIVYHAKLRDGREVAVKRLYERNFKRVTQFGNEIEILTRLHHKNLVMLYGCTSRQSQELILVYEYISNGTVADHLHGDVAKDNPLTWHIRIKIAIETASALVYLHKSDIIHRDVKTSNILLDNNFCVKVADFGLSRLFPNNVTHVSTAPQGTPGYVDPEYYQCYQLTDKSDVYSFGVVLIELLTSMPAIDINRNRSEINLAHLAMNKIQSWDFEELIDPSLGFESDPGVERMITSVTELAFRCLQLEKEMRPSMDEVLDTLINIRDYKDDESRKEIDTKPESPEADHIVLLKAINIPPSSDSVVDKSVRIPTSISSG